MHLEVREINGVNVHRIHSKISFALGIPDKLLKSYWFNWSSARNNRVVAFEAERDTTKGKKKNQMWERANICLLTEIDFATFLLFPWKSFTDFHCMKFFVSRFQVTPFSFHILKLTLQKNTVISVWIHRIKLTCPRTSGLLGVEEDVSSL